MKAWRIHAHGGMDALKREDVPLPEPGPMQARVRIEALGLNHLDLWVRKGVEGHRFPLPLTPGCDVAGVIEAWGPGAPAAVARQGLEIGSPIIVNPGVSCGTCPACLSGFDPLCPDYGIIGEHRDGGAADFVVVPAANLVARPPGITAAQAAALPIPFLTAWTMLTQKAQLRPGEVCLIHAGGSAVSVAALQMAKLLGAFVITTVGSAEKARRARELGADEVILYREQPFREELKRILSARGRGTRKGCDVVVDHVGQDTFAESFRALAWGGRLVCCGATTGSKAEFDLKPLFFKNLSILGSTMGGKAELFRIVGMVAEGRLRAVVDSTHAMDEYPAALARLERREAFGKVVVVN
jgi:NADPH:quinone reductase-like Zn-dependent oxidoreductase